MRRAFSPPDKASTLVSARVAGEADHRRAATDLRYRLSTHPLGHVIVDAAARFKLVDLMLREIADLKTVCAHHLSRQRLKASGDELRESRLAVAILAEKADAVVIGKREIHA